MATIQQAVQEQLDQLLADLLKMDPRLLTRIGISKNNREYLKRRGHQNKKPKLPPADAVLAALVLLRRNIVVEGLPGPNGKPLHCSICARDESSEQSAGHGGEPVQMSLLAGLDFPPEASATIERAERKGANRVELLLNVRIQPRAS